MHAAFIGVHLVAALVFAFGWIVLNSLFASIVHRHLTFALGIGLWPFVFQGIWLYVMVTGVCYATQATRRAARIEALAARAQLEALRAQLNPHFLFNALHTVVHLIPRQPERAAQAAEQLADLLRTTIETDREVVSLESEWDFVERYLEIERIRFGDRLDVRSDLSPQARAALVPSFALQTLVENAVRHGAMPRVEPTTLSITARMENGLLVASVQDTGLGADPATIAASTGPGLRRLRERLAALYDGRARLETVLGPTGGFTATIVVPQTLRDRDA
jgi:LytS/YehU family sensor histidine kinase